MKFHSALLLPLSAAGLLIGSIAHSATPLDQRIASILPTAGEDRWMQVPWRVNIMEARAEAQRAGKPVFLWVMNGNPLGCA